MPARPHFPGETSPLDPAASLSVSGPPGRRGILLILSSTIVYGSTPALVHLANRSVDLVDLVFYRSALAAVVLALVWQVLRRRVASTASTTPARRLGLHGVALGALLFGPHVLLFLGSLQRLDSSLAVAIGYVYPSFVIVLITLQTRRSPGRSHLLVLALALIGVTAVAAPTGGSTIDPIGVLMVVTAAALFAIYAVATAGLAAEVHPVRLGSHLLLGVALTVGCIGVATGKLTFEFDTATMMVLALHAVLTVVGIVTYTGGLALVGAARASLVDTLQPVVALAVGMSLLGERPAPLQYAGVLMIIGSVSVTARRVRRPHPPVVDAI